MRLRDVFELLLLAALWGASFLFMRIGAPEFGPLAMSAPGRPKANTEVRSMEVA